MLKSLTEAAEYLKMSRRTLLVLAREGKIGFVRETPTSHTRFTQDDLDKYVESVHIKEGDEDAEGE